MNTEVTQESKTIAVINECHRELAEIEHKLSIVLTPPLPGTLGKSVDNTTELEIQLSSLSTHIREISSRIKF